MNWTCPNCRCTLELSDFPGMQFCPRCGFRKEEESPQTKPIPLVREDQPTKPVSPVSGFRDEEKSPRPDSPPLAQQEEQGQLADTPASDSGFRDEEERPRPDTVPFIPEAEGQMPEPVSSDSGSRDEEERPRPDTVPLTQEEEEKESQQPDPVCPICGSPIGRDEESVSCPGCAALYHKECWDYNHGCAAYGCQYAPDSHQSSDSSLQDQIPCPWCHTLHSPKTVICPSCGQRTDVIPARKIQRYFNIVRTGMLIPIWDRLILLGKDCSSLWEKILPYLVFSMNSYLKSLRRYMTFSGTADRIEMANFLIMTLVIHLVLLLFQNVNHFSAFYFLLTLSPTIAILLRRLHDIGLSNYFIFVLPVLPILLFVPSQSRPLAIEAPPASTEPRDNEEK